MYSLEDRMKAVDLYFKYGCSPAAVRRELGYPTKNTVKQWAREFKATGALREKCRPRRPRYSEEQKQAAVDYYLEYGRSMRRTVRALGYPHHATLKEWLDEALPERRGLQSIGLSRPKVELTLEQRQAAVVDLESRDGSAREVSDKYGVSRTALYQWKYRLLGKERSVSRQRRGKPAVIGDEDALLAKMESLKQQVESLEKQVHRLELERDVLEVTAQILKKTRAPIRRS